MSFRFRGPKLLTKLLCLGVVLMVVPWLSYMQLLEMEQLMVQGQRNAQLLMARGVAALFHERTELFSELPLGMEGIVTLNVPPLQGTMRIDGDQSDWGIGRDQRAQLLLPGHTENDGAVQVFLGEQVDQLYLFLKTTDTQLVKRDRELFDLNSADHFRISFPSADAIPGQLNVSVSHDGIATVYEVSGDWETSSQYSPSRSVVPAVRETDDGFAIELSMPLSMFEEPGRISISFNDVDDPSTRAIVGTSEFTYESANPQHTMVIFRSEETMDLISRLGYIDARVSLYDDQGRTRGGSTGTALSSRTTTRNETGLTGMFNKIRPYLHQLVVWETWEAVTQEESEELKSEAIDLAISGTPTAIQRLSEAGKQVVMAVQPIHDGETVIGAVSVEQNIDQILSFQQSALQQIVVVSVLALFVVLLLAGGFSARLAYRIKKLKSETSTILDERGRLTDNRLRSEVKSGDEIGDLARAVDDMLARLQGHNKFIQRMPRTLRHEINNPLNTLSTSLYNLQHTEKEEERQQYMEAAQRGLVRIGTIVQNLVDATNLEESLTSERKRPVDIRRLLSSYVQNQNMQHPEVEIVFEAAPRDLIAEVSDVHIEQLLDKLIDNAIDFHREQSPLKLQLTQSQEYFRIAVANRGPTLPEDVDSLFEMLVSQRPEGTRQHFGLGLYVVRVIAEYHGGSVRARNLADGSGVVFVVDMLKRESNETAVPPVGRVTQPVDLPVSAVPQPVG